MSTEWWQGFFDDEYVRLWGGFLPLERTVAEAAAIWDLLGLQPAMRVLDAPCGFGRISRALAERGAIVTGVDYSGAQIAHAEAGRGEVPTHLLRFEQRDLRVPLEQTGFDAALNVFSSLGYGNEADDAAILSTLFAALRPAGRLLLESMHRDAIAVARSSGGPPAHRLADGTLLVEEPKFDAFTGRIETCWYWAGPNGRGEKRASLRMYSLTEFARLLGSAGFRVVSVHSGLSQEPFVSDGRGLLSRVAIVAERPADG